MMFHTMRVDEKVRNAYNYYSAENKKTTSRKYDQKAVRNMRGYFWGYI